MRIMSYFFYHWNIIFQRQLNGVIIAAHNSRFMDQIDGQTYIHQNTCATCKWEHREWTSYT